ncbi:craniofacial development protein 2-like [Corticium candelabrum]|uniref:craniofacial development protein 2-like n=1 Tax=Corticium candelabrum TaxID=121492 RepID=UPI002E255BCA|nr:craniofacial development protein 2-like [Corticium candelabrum]
MAGQHYLVIALPTSLEEGPRKGGLNKAHLLCWLGIQYCGRNKVKHNLAVACWNVRSLLDTQQQMERKTAILAKEFRRYDIDIVALSETHLLDEGKLEEVGTGYTFFWKGRPSNATRQSGVGFAVKSSFVGSLDNLPRGINDRLMTLRLPLSGGQFLTLVSSYAPTMNAFEEMKEKFYDDLRNIIGAVPKKDKLLVLGDFNARVGSNHCTWKNVLGINTALEERTVMGHFCCHFVLRTGL